MISLISNKNSIIYIVNDYTNNLFLQYVRVDLDNDMKFIK